MDQRLLEVLSLPLPSIENTQDFLNAVRLRDDLISNCAQNTHSDSTLLLETVFAADLRRVNLLSATLLLSSQTKYLSDSIVPAFNRTAKQILSALTEDMIRSLRNELPAITRAMTNTHCNMNKPKAILSLIRRIAENITTSSGTLSPVHVDVLQLAIKGSFYTLALEFIEEQDVMEVDGDQNELTSEDVLRYFYYAGICSIAAKKHRQALGHFTTVISVPALAFSHIVEESLKKCKLLSLIVHGKAYEIPRNASQIIQRYAPHTEGNRPSSSSSSSTTAAVAGAIGVSASTTSAPSSFKTDLAAYDEFAKQFVSIQGDFKTLLNSADSYKSIFERDLNVGIALQALSAWQRKKLHQLADTFVTLTIAEVTAALATPSDLETQRVLTTTVLEEGLLAHIDIQQGLIVFTEAPGAQDKSGSNERTLNMQNQLLVKQLESSMQSLLSITNRIRSAQASGLTSEEYIVKTTTSGSGAQGRGGVSTSDILDF